MYELKYRTKLNRKKTNTAAAVKRFLRHVVLVASLLQCPRKVVAPMSGYPETVGSRSAVRFSVLDSRFAASLISFMYVYFTYLSWPFSVDRRRRRRVD